MKVRKLIASPPSRAEKAVKKLKRRCSAGTAARIAIVRSTCREPLMASKIRKPKADTQQRVENWFQTDPVNNVD